MRRRTFLSSCGLGLAGCASAGPPIAFLPAPSLQVDFSGVDALLAALTSREIDDASVDAVLQTPAAQGLLEGVGRARPDLDANALRTAITDLVRAGAPIDPDFGLGRALDDMSAVRIALEALREHESEFLGRVLFAIAPYLPASGTLALIVHVLVGGPDDTRAAAAPDRDAMYVAIDRFTDDPDGLLLSVSQTLSAVMLRAARRFGGTLDAWGADAPLPAAMRLLVDVLDEGFVLHACDLRRLEVVSPRADIVRAQLDFHDEAGQIAADFDLFDRQLSALTQERTSLAAARAVGFSGTAPQNCPLAWVGQQVIKRVELEHGSGHVAARIERPPTAIFADYLAIQRSGAWVPAPLGSAVESLLRDAPT